MQHQRQFLEALDGIRRRVLACDFEIPEPKSGQIDYAAVNVEFTRTGKMPELFYYVASADKCDTAPSAAWYYDAPQQPTKVSPMLDRGGYPSQPLGAAFERVARPVRC